MEDDSAARLDAAIRRLKEATVKPRPLIELPKPLPLPFADQRVLAAPIELVDGATAHCASKAQVNQLFSNRVVSVSNYVEVFCQRQRGHTGPHVSTFHKLWLRPKYVRATCWD